MEEMNAFPSPIGELHFSIVFNAHGRLLHKKIVSVPYRGATFLNFDSAFSHGELTDLFPSPIGELHFSIVIFPSVQCVLRPVSVPYRGATFLNAHSGRSTKPKNCFRPLSGSYISQLVEISHITKNENLFPSPIGELHFSMRWTIII